MMNTNRNTVLKVIVEFLSETTRRKGATEITEETNPIKGLGLESVDGVALAVELSVKLDFEIPQHINPFIQDNPLRLRDVGEIADFVTEMIETARSRACA